MGPHWKEGFHRGGSYGLQTSQGSNLMFCFLLYYVVNKQSHIPTVIEMNHPAYHGSAGCVHSNGEPKRILPLSSFLISDIF